MTLLLGAALAAGVLLCISPWMWPRRADDTVASRTGRLTRLIEEAGLGALSSRTLVTAIVGAGAIAASVVWLITDLAVLALLAGTAGAAAPVMFLRGRRMRLRRLRRQLWPDVCDLLIASIRVGLSLPDAVATLAESAPTMLRPAFAVFARDLRASGRFETSVDRLKTSLADPIADRIIETLRMARQVGGTELIGVLRALSTSVRADAALRGEVEARQSWIRGAAVLGAVAPWVILTLLVLRPEGASAYGTPEGCS
ncbi:MULTISPECIES: type II secretion system F family protein [unclassified Microbacterium]|uniref:type II secretion system F family protein n=1 Tax=unclassified Microbacterium TaxID=2609290 RepID=UPI001FCE4241|nr:MULTISPECIES: type II secretion system F family protein [unclassified Microbacterium]